MHILHLKPANKVVEAARMLPRKTRKARKHRQGRHQSDGWDARQHRQGCRRSL